jgi:hypothetical protein
MPGMHWSQFAGTIAAFGAVAGGTAAIYFPISTRREARRESAIKAGIQAIVTEAVGVVKDDMIKRVDESDVATGKQVLELKAEIKDVKDQATATDMKLATQFGGNGGGIRQVINEQAKDLVAIKARFDQHLDEQKRT